MVKFVRETEAAVSVISDDTDVLVLLMHFYKMKNINKSIYMDSHLAERSAIDIKHSVESSENLVLLPAHALSGCDTVAT